MANDSWACLGGIELWNACRTGTYARNGFRPHGVEITPCGCCGPQMATALFDPPYTTPAADGAPWVSASEPGSQDFGGFMALSVDMLGPGVITREVTQRADGRGSFIGPPVQAGALVTVEGILFGKTCCSVDYGRRWLATALQGSCEQDCDGDELAFLQCCPDFDACAEDGISPEDCLDPQLRYLKGVKLVSSLQVVQRFGRCCGKCNGTAYMRVRFTLGAEQPCVYRDPVLIGQGVTFTVPPETTCGVTWVLVDADDECPQTGCVEPADCLVDPGCPAPPKPPAAPPSTNPCICFPFRTGRACLDIPAGSIPEWTEGLPVLTIESGAREMRQIRARFWVNNLGQDVDSLDPCNACGEVTLSRIPAGSRFTFDATRRMATISCPGAADTDATPLMGAAGGTLPVQWPEIACADTRFTVCVEADAATIAPDAEIGLSVVPTECY